MSEQINKEDIVAYECVHASYSKSNSGKASDAVIVKEIIHTKDKRKIPNVRIIENFQRDFYVTKELKRTHKDKRPYEDLENLVKHTCSQHELHDRVGRALGRPGMKGSLRQIARSPYLYGADIKTPVLVKRKYRDQWNVPPSASSYAVFDTETNMNSPEEEIIMSSITMKEKIRTSISSHWLKPEMAEGFEDKVRKRAWELIGDELRARGVTDETFIIDMQMTPAGTVVKTMEAAHQWKPDYVGIFNIAFDIPKALDACDNALYRANTELERVGINPNNVFADPSVPPKYRNFKWNKGPDKKVKKNDGENKVTPLHPVDQWHYCNTQASFIFVDPMLLYKRIRIASANDPQYSLDYLLKKHNLAQKLKFAEADGLVGRAWHEYMQEYFPVEYTVYNIFDCIATEKLDEVTGDIRFTLPALVKCSEYSSYDSQPSMIADDYHFFLLKHGKVIGTTSDEMLGDVDKFSPGLRGWIATLHAYLGPDPDKDIVKDFSDLDALIYTSVSDIDIVST